MLEMIMRLVVAGSLMAGAAYVPLLGTETGLSASRERDVKPFRACPTAQATAVRACLV